jgi:hypothetical protein
MRQSAQPSDITRRDFLNGVALTIAAGVTPWDQISAQPARLLVRALIPGVQ